MARFEEGPSISCPPLFKGEAYSQRSNIIEEGHIEAHKKKNKQMSENDTKAKLNTRAMHIILFGLSEYVSKKVSTCKRDKEI
ncbi:hypothetical protein GQ457_18G011300 [Hibiscus cannabinus]